MSKMRTTTHNSRTNSSGSVHGSKHNDRNFDYENALNIDLERVKNNEYLNCYNDPNLTFEEVELKFYTETFSEQLEKTNENYIKQRHPERCKTMEQWMKVRQNAPEETVFQIGKTEEHADVNTLVRCYNDYRRRMDEWNEEHGRPFIVLTEALHVDEAVPHIQARRVWMYEDENGMKRIGQEKALIAAGVELPNPTKKESRYNNRKKAFDAMSREVWITVCEEHGLTIEREPVPDGKHNRDKEEMIRDKYEALLVENENLKAENEEYKKYIEGYKQEVEELTANKIAQKDETAALKKECKQLLAINKELQEEIVPEIERVKSEVKAIQEVEPESIEIPEEKHAVINLAMKLVPGVFNKVYEYCKGALEKLKNNDQRRKQELTDPYKEQATTLDGRVTSIRKRLEEQPSFEDFMKEQRRKQVPGYTNTTDTPSKPKDRGGLDR